MLQAVRRFGLDRLAVTLSGLCLVHCLSGVILLSFLAVAGNALINPIFHEVGLALAIPLAAISLGNGFLKHRRLAPVLAGGAGICLMGGALAVAHGTYGEVLMTVIGVSLVAAAHLANRRSLPQR